MRFRPNQITRLSLNCLLLVAVASGGPALAGVGGEGETTETTEVKRAEEKGPKHPSLRFLKDHRVFIRARLDMLRTQTTRVRDDDARLLDERLLRLQEMAAAIAAARDTVGVERRVGAERELLDSVTELGQLEAQLSLMEQLLADQRRRLLMLEEDFLGHQETALVILVKGLSGKDAPESVVLTEQRDVVRVGLTKAQRTSLEQGGIAQIYHEFVEPRAHTFEVTFTGPEAWSGSAPVSVVVDPARDRLTFLELDLSRLDPKHEIVGLQTSVWYR